MLSISDLMTADDSIQPLGSRKGLLNKPTNLKLNMNELFMSNSNTYLLNEGLYSIYRQNGGKSTSNKFEQFISLLQKKFVKENNLTAYTTVESSATGINNHVEALRAINSDFTKFTYGYFRWDNYNPFKDMIEVGTYEGRVLKKSSDIASDDHGTLDLWREQTVQLMGRQYRAFNKIPVYQTSLHTRHFDRGNEGLAFNNPDRASLDTPIHGYDLSNIYDNISNYKSSSWFSM